MNKQSIKSTYLPKDELSYNEWAKQFGVGSNIPIKYPDVLKHSLNDGYDFRKLIPKTQKFGINDILELLKFKFL